MQAVASQVFSMLELHQLQSDRFTRKAIKKSAAFCFEVPRADNPVALVFCPNHVTSYRATYKTWTYRVAFRRLGFIPDQVTRKAFCYLCRAQSLETMITL